MTFHENITFLKNQMDGIESFEQLRSVLLEKNLKLVITLSSDGITNFDWDVTQKKVAGILRLGMLLRLSKLKGDDILLETRNHQSIHFDSIDLVEQKDLFSLLKRGIKDCLNRIY